jgi:TIR domain
VTALVCADDLEKPISDGRLPAQATAVDATEQLRLDHQIAEARAKLQELAGEHLRLEVLGDLYAQAANSDIDPAIRLRRYLLPLIEGYLGLEDREQARRWRQRVSDHWQLPKAEREALSVLDERLLAAPGAPGLEVFLSHNSQDKPAVRALAAALRERGLIVWLDEEELRPGLNWQDLLEGGIRHSASIAVLVGADGLGPWENEEMQAALRLAVEDGRPVIPVLLPDAPKRPELPLFLRNRTWVDLRPALEDAGQDRLEWGITGRKPDHHAAKPGRASFVPARGAGHGRARLRAPKCMRWLGTSCNYARLWKENFPKQKFSFCEKMQGFLR